MFKIITDVTVEPVTSTEVKLHCKIDTSDDDTLVTILITQAREWVEHYLGRSVGAKTLEMVLDAFPESAIDIDVPPVVSVTSVKYTDLNGDEQTVSSSDYVLYSYGDSSQIQPDYGFAWPSTQAIAGAVRVRYVAGYDGTVHVLPKSIKNGILLLTEHYYRNRGGKEDVPPGIYAIFDPYKIWSK